jgi:hypothetical protein
MLIALVASLLIVGIPTLAATHGSSSKRRTIIVGAGLGTVLFVTNAIYFYHGQPVVGFTWDSFYQSYWLWWIELLVVSVGLGIESWLSSDDNSYQYGVRDTIHAAAKRFTLGTWVTIIVVVIGLIFGLIVGLGGVFTQGRANELKTVLKVTVHEDVNQAPDTDSAHILTVPPQVVNYKVKSALRGDATTRFVVDEANSEVTVAGKRYALTSIVPDDIRDYNKVEGNAWGYIATDLENYAVNSQYKWDSRKDGDNPYLMKVHREGWFQHDVQRSVWHKYRGQIVDGLHLEVDDNWRPYYVASLNTRPFGFNFGQTFPKKVLVIDAHTGADRVYELDKAPAWIDRVWSKDSVKSALDAWGRWGQADYGFWPWSESKTNRYKVSGDPQLVATSTGLAWQVLMTSYGRDTVASYYVLVNSRTGKTDAYKVPELQLEEKVQETISGSGANSALQLVPSNLALYKINGTLTWVAPMLKKGAGTGDSDESNFNGLALLPANDVNGPAVTLKTTGGDITGEAFKAYEQFLSTQQTTGGPQTEVNNKTITGTVESVSLPLVEGNSTALYFTLKETSGVEYRVEVNKNAEVKYMKGGRKVVITFRQTTKSPFSVVDYDDTTLSLK